MNIDKFETRKIKRKTRITFPEEEKISKLVNAGDLNYLLILSNSLAVERGMPKCFAFKCSTSAPQGSQVPQQPGRRAMYL